MGAEWKELKADGLDRIERGINNALDELRELGSIGDAATGRGFENVSLSGVQLGHGELTKAFEEFCERWEWGVRTLLIEGNNFAQGVGLAAGAYHETEQYIDGTLKVGANALMGNPHATEEEVTAQSWDQIRQNHAFANPDYSLETVEQAKANMEQGWKDAGRDLATSDMGLAAPIRDTTLEAAGISEEQYERSLDEQFGPSPKERARAAQQQAIADGQQGAQG
ncbi:hypothetical protein QIS99_31745 [Streptomyces sp. B-S-A8]|uniref:Uncharacterized protein n=1 Tax=Streptomyces solicavernae TaxID=3043614 RepID=A0ABT6S2D3_9ACTN|nr:hypothetical protein [Streptomyces sp. B-S-A8]MDI3390735.1 hypothetical protein [Streptomyces sp. B-S-A8]